MPCEDCSTDDLCRCGPGETCGHCFESKEPEPEKPVLMCTCGCPRGQHENRKGACYSCTCAGFRCDHTRCGWKPPEEAHDFVSPAHCAACMRSWLPSGSVPEPEPRCEGCGHPEHSGFCRELEMSGPPGSVDECGCLSASPSEDPPLTPEEEEEAPEDEEPFPRALRAAGVDPEDVPVAAPPQPDRRPPIAVAYSVQGHLYEVALPGDATVRAVDGALVIQHHLGPVAGICQVLPIINEEQ